MDLPAIMKFNLFRSSSAPSIMKRIGFFGHNPKRIIRMYAIPPNPKRVNHVFTGWPAAGKRHEKELWADFKKRRKVCNAKRRKREKTAKWTEVRS